MTDLAAGWVPALGAALLHFLWQGALVGLLAWLALAVLRDARPATRYAVACGALLACVLLPVATLCIALLDAGALQATTSFNASAPAAAAVEPALASTIRMRPTLPFDAMPWVVSLWAAGAATLSLRMGCGLLWVRQQCRHAIDDADGHWQGRVDALALRLGIRRPVPLRLARDGDTPMTVGWWRPVVLLPVAVAARLPVDLVEALLAHELAHVRRHDYLVNLLQGAAESLLFYHPVTWWLSRVIRVERELVADDLAADAIGDRRRLAIALSELARVEPTRSAPSRLAPAANGGQLMPRIQSLIRPDRRRPGATLVLPLVGLALAGAAFHAWARMDMQGDFTDHAAASRVLVAQALPAPSATPGTAVLPAPTGNAAGSRVPAPPAAPGAPPAIPAPPAPPAPGALTASPALPAAAPDAPPPPPAAPPAPRPPAAPKPPKPPRGVHTFAPRDGHAMALVRGDDQHTVMSGDVRDMDDLAAAQRAIDGDFLWFRRDGKAYVVRDAATVSRARAAWAATDALSREMQALNARMAPHSARMQALGERMHALAAPDAFDTPEMRAATARMQALGNRMAPLAERQAALAARMHAADAAERARIEREMEAVGRQQEALGAEMERHGALLEAASERMERQHAPMEAIGRKMEAEGEKMEVVGAEMERLGERIEREAHAAEAAMRTLVDAAVRDGHAQPAPARRD
ncbi:hypothetical protein GCM10028862_01360 [Luteimonas pelagia]